MNPLVSIIIPNYNHAAFLQKRIESIINQSYSDFEIIILDDASTDSSKIIIDQYKTHSKVTHVIYNSTNSGSPFSQWKKGLELATGKYIWIAESDDDAHTDFLELLTTILENNDDMMLIFSDSERNDLNWKKVEQQTQVQAQIFTGENFVSQKMLTSPAIINASAVLFRKKAVVHSILQESKNYKSAFDWLFWCSIIMQGNITFYPAKLNFFRNHPQSTSLKATRQGLFVSEGLQVIASLKEKYQINLNQVQCKTWASVWAQTCLLSHETKNFFFRSKKQAWLVSPILLVWFVYYLLKYKFFSKPNIQIENFSE